MPKKELKISIRANKQNIELGFHKDKSIGFILIPRNNSLSILTDVANMLEYIELAYVMELENETESEIALSKLVNALKYNGVKLREIETIRKRTRKEEAKKLSKVN